MKLWNWRGRSQLPGGNSLREQAVSLVIIPGNLNTHVPGSLDREAIRNTAPSPPVTADMIDRLDHDDQVDT